MNIVLAYKMTQFNFVGFLEIDSLSKIKYVHKGKVKVLNILKFSV